MYSIKDKVLDYMTERPGAHHISGVATALWLSQRQVSAAMNELYHLGALTRVARGWYEVSKEDRIVKRMVFLNGKRLERVFVKGKGWYAWNSVWRHYNAVPNGTPFLMASDLPNVSHKGIDITE